VVRGLALTRSELVRLYVDGASAILVCVYGFYRIVLVATATAGGKFQ